MASAKRAMTSSQAREVKVQGHVNERQFAALIGGHVNKGSHTDKKDVLDQNDGTHSVKAGEWWQIFLYGRDRIATNTMFQALGDTGEILLECIDSFPENYDDYLANKDAAKQAVRPHMKNLLAELQKPKIGRAFFEKALFDGGNADYLSVYPYPGRARDLLEKKSFHIFHKDDVVQALMGDISFANSQARRKGQVSEQKVVLKSSLLGRQIGEIEIRTDRKDHYRRVKFRLNSEAMTQILKDSLPPAAKPSGKIYTYGKAVQPFSKQNLPQTLPQTLPPILP